MTIAQRIAQVRKEQNLSQEAFGEALGVSRQAISKWEAATAMPEVEKLVTLCRTFDVRIEWLLCMTDERRPPDTPPDALTEAQLKLVEEIVSRYLEALPPPRRLSRRAKGCIVLAAAAAVVALAVTVMRLMDRIDRLQFDNTSLQHSVASIQSEMSGQVGRMTERMEEILKSQNDLTADYGHEVAAVDLAAGTVTLAARAVPKQYVPGMTARFFAESGGGTAEAAGVLGDDLGFTAELTCPLSDQISLSVVFDDGQSLKTQFLGEETYLASDTWLHIHGDVPQLDTVILHRGRLTVDQLAADVYADGPYGDWAGDVRPATVELRFYINDVLAERFPAQDYAPPVEEPVTDPGVRDGAYRIFPNVRVPLLELSLEPGDRLNAVAVVTDNYGRRFSGLLAHLFVNDGGQLDREDYDFPEGYGLED